MKTRILSCGRFFLIIAAILLTLNACAQQQPVQLTVSAASNLIPAFEEIATQFESETGIAVVYNFASSGTLTQQIEQGAPADVFASADSAYVQRLVDGGFVVPDSVHPYARGRLVIWSRDPALLPQSLADLIQPGIGKIAIANPEHAPYGVVARTVLENGNLWEPLYPQLILGDNVRQTLTYAQTGDVAVALVPLSLVIELNEGAYYLIPDSYHDPLVQSLGIVTGSANKKEAQQFVDFILSQTGQAILRDYGYEPVQ